RVSASAGFGNNQTVYRHEAPDSSPAKASAGLQGDPDRGVAGSGSASRDAGIQASGRERVGDRNAGGPDTGPRTSGHQPAGRHKTGRRGRYHGGRGQRRGRGPYYAALDLGTNNCRLLVAEPDGQTFRVVDSFSRIVRLGEGLSQSGRLNDAAMDRAIGALRVCRDKMRSRRIAGVRMIATEACRRAENGKHFMERVSAEVGIDLEVVDRRTEAQLAAAGCSALMDPDADGAILFDIGGGSSEIVWLDRKKNRRHGLIKAWVSLPVGVVTLAEKHGGVDVDPAIFAAMVEDVRTEFGRFRARDALGRAIAERPFHYLGTSGTVTTLAGVHLELPRYNRRHVDGLWMEKDDISRMMTRITAMDYDARVANPCIGAERADLVLAGCAIFEAIRQEWPLDRLRVADRGLREGILVKLMRADGHLAPPASRRRSRQPVSGRTNPNIAPGAHAGPQDGRRDDSDRRDESTSNEKDH
ncbi:MAG: Ppx/GppA phosphatase family protein, partial [Alphaproteobacteria bacterium]